MKIVNLVSSSSYFQDYSSYDELIMENKITNSKDLIIGIFFASLSFLLFAIQDANAKYLQLFLPTDQVIFSRFFINLLLCGVIALFIDKKLLVIGSIKIQFFRGLFMALVAIFNFTALKYLRLDQTGAIFFLAPIISCFLAQFFLKEKVGIRRYIAMLFAFVGMLIVIEPGYGDFHIAMLLSLGSAISFALFTIVTRMSTFHEHPITNLIYLPIIGVVLTFYQGISSWQNPDSAFIWSVLIAMGLMGILPHLCLILALKKIEASVIAPFHYQQILFMVALGWLYFQQLPTLNVIIGIIIIIASGIYIWYRENSKVKVI